MSRVFRGGGNIWLLCFLIRTWCHDWFCIRCGTLKWMKGGIHIMIRWRSSSFMWSGGFGILNKWFMNCGCGSICSMWAYRILMSCGDALWFRGRSLMWFGCSWRGFLWDYRRTFLLIDFFLFIDFRGSRDIFRGGWASLQEWISCPNLMQYLQYLGDFSYSIDCQKPKRESPYSNQNLEESFLKRSI